MHRWIALFFIAQFLAGAVAEEVTEIVPLVRILANPDQFVMKRVKTQGYLLDGMLRLNDDRHAQIWGHWGMNLELQGSPERRCRIKPPSSFVAVSGRIVVYEEQHQHAYKTIRLDSLQYPAEDGFECELVTAPLRATCFSFSCEDKDALAQHVNQAWQHFSNSNYKEAVAISNRCINQFKPNASDSLRLRSDVANCHYVKGASLEFLGDYSGAEEAMRIAMQTEGAVGPVFEGLRTRSAFSTALVPEIERIRAIISYTEKIQGAR